MAFLSLGMFFACSDSGDGDSAVSDNSGNGGGETLVTKYTSNLTSNANYYIVNEFHCVDKGDNTYDVRTTNRHFFKNTSESYKDKTGPELINMVKAKSVTATNSETLTQSKDAVQKATNAATGVTWTFNIPEGMTFAIYYYE